MITFSLISSQSRTLFPFELGKAAITLVVGPNSVGKSTLITELDQRSSSIEDQSIVGSSKWLGAYEPTIPNAEELSTFVSANPAPTAANANRNPNSVYVYTPSVSEFAFDRGYAEGRRPMRRSDAAVFWIRPQQLNLSYFRRMQLLSAGHVNVAPDGLAHLYNRLIKNRELRLTIRETVHRAFGLYLCVDIRNTSRVVLCLSKRRPNIETELLLDGPDVAALEDATPLAQCSHGVISFTTAIAGAYEDFARLILIDEPEIALSPALARSLGLELAQIVKKRKAQMIVATHSAQFVLGAMSAGVECEIVRLSLTANTPTARLLQKDKLVPLFKKPMLRASRVIDGVFHRAVVVCEGETDRVFYEEIYSRLVAAKVVPEADVMFTSSNGKQNVYEIVEALRLLGVPAAAIVDIDVLKNGGDEWSRLLRACQLPDPQLTALSTLRATLHAYYKDLETDGHDPKREGGLVLFDQENAEAARNLFKSLADYGLFILPHGEVESWLPELSVGRGKSTWLGEMLTRLGADDSNSAYVKPPAPPLSPDTVWDFLERVGKWVANPARQGVR